MIERKNKTRVRDFSSKKKVVGLSLWVVNVTIIVYLKYKVKLITKQ